MVLNETFGAAGTGTAFFGGQWWLLGLYLLLLFVTFLVAYRVPAEAIGLFVVIGLVSTGAYQLFVINEAITQTILLIIFIFFGYLAYLWFKR